MRKKLNDMMFVFPVMLYYTFEALIVCIFITLIWKLTLSKAIGNITYIQFVGAYWIIKMLLFDVFKLVAGLKSAGSNMENENVEE